MDEQKLVEYVIPDNILESKRIMGFRRRNWIEGLICTGILVFIIWLIPFVLRVKLIFCVVLGAVVLLINLKGINDQSMLEAISNFKQGIANSGNYHLRRPDRNEKYKSKLAEQGVKGVGYGDSYADKLVAQVKNFINKYSR